MATRPEGTGYTSAVDIDVVLHTRRCADELLEDHAAVTLANEAMLALAQDAGLQWLSELVGRSPEQKISSRASVALIGTAAQVVRACHEGATREAAIGTAIANLEAFLATERCAWRLQAPLRGVSVVDGPHILAENTTIRVADDDFKQHLWATHGPGAPQLATLSADDALAVRGFDAVLELSFERDRDSWPTMPVLAEKVDRVLTAFRVFGARRLVAPLLWAQGPPMLESFGRGAGSILQQDRSALEHTWRAQAGTAVVIDGATARQMREWVEQLAARPEDDALMFAVQRFNLCDARIRDDDRLVDAWIALEALFSTHKDRGAIAYRVALRLALLCANDPRDRQEIRDFIGLSYGLRSTIVHGVPVESRAKRYESAREIVSRTEDLLRETLRRWVQAGYGSSSEIVALLEAHALRSAPLH
jgi:hypothetical protein